MCLFHLLVTYSSKSYSNAYLIQYLLSEFFGYIPEVQGEARFIP